MEVRFAGEMPEIILEMERFLNQCGYELVFGENMLTTDIPDQPEKSDASGTGEPEKPKKKTTRKKKAAPKEEQHSKNADTNSEPESSENSGEPETDPAAEMSAADAKKEGLAILMDLYNNGKQDDVKALLGDFGVKKFGEVPEERGHELLGRAQDLQKEAA